MSPDPRANPWLVGQDAAETCVLEAWRSGRMHHAWLLTGNEGIGKATLAYRFARRLLAGGPAETLAMAAGNPVFRRVAAGSHADLHTVARSINPSTKKLRTEIGVDDVRDAGEFLRLTPAEGGWRVVIVDSADELNRNAANALLKVLEEPPARAVLLLVCAAPGRLPATVRSRCRRLALSPLDDAAMAAVLATYLPALDAAERARLAAVAEGSPGRALLLADEAGLKLSALVDDVLAALPRVAPEKAYAVAEALGRTDGAFGTFMDLLRAGLSAAVRDTLRGRAEQAQQRIAGLRPAAEWAGIWQDLGRLQSDTERFNLDKRQALVTGLAMICAAGALS